MPLISKPANLSLTWASGGDILNPGDAKYANGWEVEIPPRQWFNYLDNRQDEAIAHLNQLGVSDWDNTTEYQEAKSYVQGLNNGVVYRCKTTHTNQNPESDVSEVYWEVAFASQASFLGGNQLLESYGFQKLPGGLILQWGQSAGTIDGVASVMYPVAFPNAAFQVMATSIAPATTTVPAANVASTDSPTSVTFYLAESTLSGVGIRWFAIGY